MSAPGQFERLLPALHEAVARIRPGASLVRVVPLGTDVEDHVATAKALGYGQPLRLELRTADGRAETLVLHAAQPDAYGHDRRSDRAGSLLLAYDTFGSVPRHVRALDVGLLEPDGHLISLAHAGEPYLLTTWIPGREYAQDLRRVARDARLAPRDRARCELLAHYLAELHADRGGPAPVWRRAVRDLIGHGEGVFGIVDGFADDVPGAPRARLDAIEQACVAWRPRLRARSHRLARTHGDFHPFNVLFDDAGNLGLLDASRGGRGDPADDVACMAINYVFFALGSPRAWPGALGALWASFFRAYLEATGDHELFEVIAPFLAWRALVLASPAWYPELSAEARDRLLGLAERALAAEVFDPTWADALFA